MIFLRTFCFCALFILLVGVSCKKSEGDSAANTVTVDLPEKIEFSPSGQMPAPPDSSPAKVQGQPIVEDKSGSAPKKTAAIKIPAQEPQKPAFRDPFLSYLNSASSENESQGRKASLLDFDVKTYKYVGFILSRGAPLALIEDPSGVGFTVKLGIPLGLNGGRIESIQPSQIIVKEEKNKTFLKFGH